MWKNQAVLRFFCNKKVRRQWNKIWREGKRDSRIWYSTKLFVYIDKRQTFSNQKNEKIYIHEPFLKVFAGKRQLWQQKMCFQEESQPPDPWMAPEHGQSTGGLWFVLPQPLGDLVRLQFLELNPSLFKIPRMFCLLHWNLEDTALFWFFTIAVIIFIFAKTIQWFSFKQIKNMEANTRKRLWCCILDGSIWKAIPFYFLNSFPPKYFSFKEMSISF